LPHISYSELKNWEFCPLYHKLVHIDGIKAFKGNEYTAFGTAIHDVCEKQLLKEEFNPSQVFVEKFKGALNTLEDGNVKFNLSRAMEMVPQGIAILPEIEPALVDYFGESFEVFSSEEKLMVPIDDDLDFKGYIDAVIKTPDDKYHVVDWKTTSWGWDQRRRSDPIVNYQLTLYKHFFCKKHNIDPKNVETHFALLKRTAKKDRVEFFRVTSGEKKTKNALKLLDIAIYNINKKRYLKKRTSCNNCAFNMTKECP
jgi:ATP-dependent exoDNAse (exonuclease V) beta subunit